MAVVYYPGGARLRVEPARFKKFKIDELQRWVADGGTVEIHPGLHGDRLVQLVCDEEGNRKGLEYNEIATTMLRAYFRRQGFMSGLAYLVGPVLVPDEGEL